MLVWLAEYLTQYYSGFHVFSYLTLRAILGVLTAMAIALLFGGRTIAWLKGLQWGQTVRDDGPKSHLSKAGTPTMGGVMILVAVLASMLLWCKLENRYVWVMVFVLGAFGAVGFLDDYRKIVRKDPKGLIARWKYFWLSIAAIGTSLFLYVTAQTPAETQLMLPFMKEVMPQMGLWYLLFSYFVMVGTSNAVNFTDGLDGLAIMPVVMVGSALGVFAYVTGSSVFSKYLLLPYIPGAGELLIFCAAMAGAGLAFLWFNTHPAQVFMGDVGALALGGALGTIAVIVRQEIVLAIMGGIFVVEALSVMLQVTWFKYTKRRFGAGRRLFQMAPLHHHFEKKGWKETQVVVRFWIITMLLCLVGLSTLKLR